MYNYIQFSLVSPHMVSLGVLVVGQCVEDAIGYGRSQLPVLGAGQVVFPLAGSYVVLSGCERHVAYRPTHSRFVENNARSLVVMDEGH